METNRERLLAAYDAWNRSDVDAWLDFLDPQIELWNSGVFPDLELVYRGHEGLAEFWHRVHEPWESLRIDVTRVDAEGEDVYLTTLRFRARGAESGVDVDMHFGHAIRLRDGLATQIVARATIDEAREALLAAG